VEKFDSAIVEPSRESKKTHSDVKLQQAIVEPRNTPPAVIESRSERISDLTVSLRLSSDVLMYY